MWNIGPDSGGGLECRVRNRRTVPGKQALRIMLSFETWRPDPAGELGLRPLPPLAADRKKLAHRVTFQSDAEITPWSEHDMVMATAGLCAALQWTPVGGTKQQLVAKQAEAIRQELGIRSCRHPVTRPLTSTAAGAPAACQAATSTTTASLWEWYQDRPQEEPK